MSNQKNAKKDVNGKKEIKTIPVKIPKEPRQVIQDRIMDVLSKHPNGLSLKQLEDEGQKLKNLPIGRYAGVSKSEFKTTKNKDGEIIVHPSVSDRGFNIGSKYTIERGSIHWTIRNFPKEAIETSKRLKFSEKDITTLENAFSEFQKKVSA